MEQSGESDSNPQNYTLTGSPNSLGGSVPCPFCHKALFHWDTTESLPSAETTACHIVHHGLTASPHPEHLQFPLYPHCGQFGAESGTAPMLPEPVQAWGPRAQH